MENWDSKKNEILRTAARLFFHQGYDDTSMRQIAEKSGVSLGLINYHFGSKKRMGVLLVRHHLLTLQDYVVERVPDDLRLRFATLMRLNYKVQTSPLIRRFYEDMLKNDIYFEALSQAQAYGEEQSSLSLSEKYALLRESYLPVSLERAMVMCPFADQLDIDVPDLVFKYFIYGFINENPPQHDVDWYLAKSKELVLEILSEHPYLFDIFQTVPELNSFYPQQH